MTNAPVLLVRYGFPEIGLDATSAAGSLSSNAEQSFYAELFLKYGF